MVYMLDVYGKSRWLVDLRKVAERETIRKGGRKQQKQKQNSQIAYFNYITGYDFY